MPKTDKLIISHKGNLKAKYAKNLNRIVRALRLLESSAKKAGLKTKLMFVDDAAAMKRCKSGVVTSPVSPRQFKSAIDDLYHYFNPDYIVIAGAQDIVPFQPLTNPAVHLDEEPDVPSDLPYACESPYSTDPKKFLSPGRVVGRIPDIPGIGDPEYFEALIKTATDWECRDSSFYQKYFALSTVSWEGSTSKNISRLFSNTKHLNYSPKKGPAFKKTELAVPTHFINCHGALEEPTFYGEKGEDQPDALYAKTLTGRILPGTIVAAECCYGAQLFNPEEVGHISIANNYLLQKAIAFLGSSNVAYGPEDNLALADLLTQYFLCNIFDGASTGRALLEARIKFLQDSGPYLDVMELKTVAQFYLLGDPSIHPVKAIDNTVSKSGSAEWMNTRANRRINLKAKGLALRKSIVPPVHSGKAPVLHPGTNKLLSENGMKGELKKEVYINAEPKSPGNHPSAKAMNGNVRFIAYAKKMSNDESRLVRRKILMIKEKNNQLLGSRVYVSR